MDASYQVGSSCPKHESHFDTVTDSSTHSVQAALDALIAEQIHGTKRGHVVPDEHVT